MRKPTALDWIGATIAWFAASLVIGVGISEGFNASEEVAISTFLALFGAGIMGARVWWLRRPESQQVGLTTGEAQMTRLEELEMRMVEMESVQLRLAEVEERLDFTERLLARVPQGQPGEDHNA